jgi:hypothetical protein
LRFTSKLDWGGTREPKNGQKDYHKNYGYIVSRNGRYIVSKHKDFFTGNYTEALSIRDDFNKFSREWVDTPEANDLIYTYFDDKVKNIRFLNEHSNFVGQYKYGFGERPFFYIWAMLVSQMKSDFKFLEIGVYKGSILCLVKAANDYFGKNGKMYGLSPLSNLGDRYSSYENDDYYKCICDIYNYFSLDLRTTTLIQSVSTDDVGKSAVREEGPYDIIYVDGGHDYKTVVNDVELSDSILKVGGYLVFDDASTHINLGTKSVFKGHPDVGDAVRDLVESNPSYKHLFACGHNRVFIKEK